MSCAVCGAPAFPRAGACVFCRSPLGDGNAPPGLLDYLAARVPGARAKRGFLGRGQVREVRVEVDGEAFSARLRRGRLRLAPELQPGEWVDRLLTVLSRKAAVDADYRDAVSRAGWALR